MSPKRKKRKKKASTKNSIGGVLTWEQLIEIGLRDLGLSPHAFWSLTFAELWLLIEHHREKQKLAWQQQAYLAAVMINIHRDPKKPAIGIDDLMKAPEETAQEEAEIPDEDYMKYIKEKYSK